MTGISWNKIADQIFSWEEDGQVSRTLGGYTQWLEERQNRQQERPAAKAEKEKAPERSRSRKLKFSYKEEREYQAIDGEIAGLEEQISAVEEEMAQSAADFGPPGRADGPKSSFGRTAVRKDRPVGLSQ